MLICRGTWRKRLRRPTTRHALVNGVFQGFCLFGLCEMFQLRCAPDGRLALQYLWAAIPTRVIRGVRLRFGISTPSSVILTIGLFPSGTSFSPPSSLCAFLLFSSPFAWSSFGSLWRFDGVCPPSGSTLGFSCRNVWFLVCWVHCDAFASVYYL